MKIFVSHSSKDKWAARRISEDLIGLGVKTFLDEKDITTGESIDIAIRSHMRECDHFLIILSPSSIKSEWVLLELGGAFALEKTVVPVLLYVGVNNLPKLISLKLAVDINNISQYYEEVKRLITGTKKKPSPLKKKTVSKRSTYSVGDVVQITSKRPDTIFRDGDSDLNFVDEMIPYLGQIAKIEEIDEDGDYILNIDNAKFAWAKEWLIKKTLPA